jgi:FAD/FMN-containing dehydrogenase
MLPIIPHSEVSVASRVLSDDRVRDLSARFRGDLILPASPDYESARAVWNGMIDRRPAVIARCKSTADVQAAIQFGRDNDLTIAIRGGGHSAAGLAVCEGGIVIDLSGLRDVVVDPDTRTARVGGGATWGDLDAATAKHGLATTGGAVSTTGIAGLTLGGGLGWLMRGCGLACDNLIGAEIVTADGQVVHASESENTDLLWALRGGGGNFGVVTSFEYRLYPVSTVLGGILFFPLARARDVLRFYRDFTRTTPDALTVFCAMMCTPEGMPVVALALCYNGPVSEGERAIKAVRDFGTPIAGEIGPMPYTALQSMLDAGFPTGLQVHWRSEFVTSIPDALVDAAVSAFERVPSPLSAILFEQLGGAVARVPRDAAAFDNRDADYNLAIISRWADAGDAAPNVAWSRSTSDAAKPFTNGRVYLNYIGAGEAPDRVRAAFSQDKFAQLSSIKRKYDPNNVFRMNQNIPPG